MLEWLRRGKGMWYSVRSGCQALTLVACFLWRARRAHVWVRLWFGPRWTCERKDFLRQRGHVLVRIQLWSREKKVFDSRIINMVCEKNETLATYHWSLVMLTLGTVEVRGSRIVLTEKGSQKGETWQLQYLLLEKTNDNEIYVQIYLRKTKQTWVWMFLRSFGPLHKPFRGPIEFGL